MFIIRPHSRMEIREFSRRGRSSTGRAPRSQRGGRGFKSHRLHLIQSFTNVGSRIDAESRSFCFNRRKRAFPLRSPRLTSSLLVGTILEHFIETQRINRYEVQVKLPGQIQDVALLDKQRVGTPEDTAYLALYSLRVQNRYTDGSKSAVYRYEGVLRKWLDAVVLVLTTRINDVVHLCLRTSIRPPLLLRRGLDLPQPDDHTPFALLELPAGLIEGSDKGNAGLNRRAAAETLEETGYCVPADGFALLGTAPFVSPGVIPEKMIFMTARVEDIKDRSRPEGDGSPAEEGADIVWVGVDDALKMCDNGTIVDMKTELGIRRLAALLASTRI